MWSHSSVTSSTAAQQVIISEQAEGPVSLITVPKTSHPMWWGTVADHARLVRLVLVWQLKPRRFSLTHTNIWSIGHCSPLNVNTSLFWQEDTAQLMSYLVEIFDLGVRVWRLYRKHSWRHFKYVRCILLIMKCPQNDLKVIEIQSWTVFFFRRIAKKMMLYPQRSVEGHVACAQFEMFIKF